MPSLVVLVDDAAYGGADEDEECGEPEPPVPRPEVLLVVDLLVLKCAREVMILSWKPLRFAVLGIFC